VLDAQAVTTGTGNHDARTDKGSCTRRVGRDDRQDGETARKAAAWTQAEVAERVGIASQVYGRLERGEMRPSIDSFRNLVLVLGVAPEEALGIPRKRSADAGRSRKRESTLVQQLIHAARDLDVERLLPLVKLARALVRAKPRKRGRR